MTCLSSRLTIEKPFLEFLKKGLTYYSELKMIFMNDWIPASALAAGKHQPVNSE
jgi:hypothetical protein